MKRFYYLNKSQMELAIFAVDKSKKQCKLKQVMNLKDSVIYVDD